MNFYAVPTAVFKVKEPNQADRYFKIDFEQGQRVVVAFENNHLEIEKVVGGRFGINTSNEAALQWIFTNRGFWRCSRSVLMVLISNHAAAALV